MIIDIIEIRERLNKSYGHLDSLHIGDIVASNKQAFNEYKIQLDLLGFQIAYLSNLEKEKRREEARKRNNKSK